MFTNIKTIHEGTRYRIKDREKSEVFHYICQYVGATRKEIVNISKIRPSTVSRIAGSCWIRNLFMKGIIKIAEKRDVRRFLCILILINLYPSRSMLFHKKYTGFFLISMEIFLKKRVSRSL